MKSQHVTTAESYTEAEIRGLAADLCLSPEDVISKVRAYSVGSFRVGPHTILHVKRMAESYRVRLSVKVREPVTVTSCTPVACPALTDSQH